MRKKVITIQLDPMVLAQCWQYGKDAGLCKQVAIQELIVRGLYEVSIKPRGPKCT